MSENDVPAAPDYSPIIQAQTQIANTAQQHSSEILKWAREQFANNKQFADDVKNGLIRSRDEAQEASTTDRAASGALLEPGEQRLLDNLNKYTDPARKAADMGAAQAQVAQNFGAARDNATRELESYGINPASVRYGALDLGLRTQQAAAAASAGNVASRTDDALADQALDKVITQGNNRVTQANQNAATANAAGTGATATDLAVTASGANTQNAALPWLNTAAGAYGGAGNTMNTQYGNQSKQFENEKSNSSGIGSLLGGLAGLSTNSVGGSLLMALEEGGAIPMEASPSRGAITDDIPAKVNAGEFIVPRDVALWKGEEFFQKLIEQSRKSKEGAQAKPQMSAIPAGQPPAGGGALPVG